MLGATVARAEPSDAGKPEESAGPIAPGELTPARPGLSPVPLADLTALEDVVARQLADAQDSLAALVSQDGLADAELSQAFGAMGQLYHAYEFFASAEACYTNALHLTPQSFEWIYLLATLQLSQGQLEPAIASYEQARRLAPDNLACLVNLGKAYLEANQTQVAQEVFRRAAELDSRSAAVQAGLGQAAFAQEHYEEAVSHFEAALQLVPGANRLHYPLAMAYRRLKKEDQAKAHLEQRGTVGVKVADPLIAQIESLVQGARLQLVRGKLAFQAERYREAAAAFNAAVQADPENVAAWVNLGTVLVQLGRAEPAITHFREALRLDSDNTTAHYNLGALLLSSGQAAAAVPHLQTTIIDAPKDVQAHAQLGSALRQLGREQEALVHYAIAADLRPDDETLVRWIAELLSRQGRFQAARQRLEVAHQRFPSRGHTAHALARLLATSPDPAVRDGQRALDLAQKVYQAKNSPQYAETVAFALAELGRCQEASEWQRKLVEIAEKEGDAVLTRRLKTALTRYEHSSPCHAPVQRTTPEPVVGQTEPAAAPAKGNDGQAEARPEQPAVEAPTT